jgi:two-component system response regulator PilR (NtrC family)
MQVKLLRVLQDGKVRPVGGTIEIPTDVRIVATTNRSLEEMVAGNEFREDLFYRINVLPIHLPPLRDRREDIPILVEHFLRTFRRKLGRGPERVGQEAMEVLENYEWPGNIRELENVMERAVTLETGEDLSPTSLPDRLKGPVGGDAVSDVVREFFRQKSDGGQAMDEYLDRIHRRLIEEALSRAGGNKTQAAEILGTTFRSLRYYAEKYGLKIT